jgi:ABC-type multidrug transport system fused ATPase/permease subunit
VSDARGPRFALVVVSVPASIAAALLTAYGARFVRSDLSRTVEEVREEQAERDRVRGGGEVPVLQVRNLDAGYGSVQVLFGVDLDVREGEVLALLGTNGAGKSTLLRAVSGLLTPTRGVIRLDGRQITFTDAPTRVGLGVVQVPGGKAVFPSLTVAENLLAGAHRYGGTATGSASAWRTWCRCCRGSASGTTRRPARCPAASSRCSRSARRCCSSRDCS